MLRLKPTAGFCGLGPQAVLAALVVYSIFESHDLDCVVTSCNDSRHGAKSKHWIGAALDFRTKHIASDATKARIVVQVKESLGADFDVVLESLGQDNEHLHVEFDPER